jgi:AcrR family transcriptional regulator
MPIKEPSRQSYHHGDLAVSLVAAAVVLLEQQGPASLSLRAVARAAGVSHGAPAHHFGDKTGLLTAVASEGHALLALALADKQRHKRSANKRLIAAGEAYIRFAVANPAHFGIMFQSDLIDCNNVDYLAAAAVTRQVLEDGVRALGVDSERAIASRVIRLWSQVHGFSVLWLAGNFGDPGDVDLLQSLLSDMLSGFEADLS